MSLPEIRHCLICQRAFNDKGKRLTLIGLYGICPDVEIPIKNFRQHLVGLTFLLRGVGWPGGTFEVSGQITDDKGEVVHAIPAAETTCNTPERELYFSLSLRKVRFPRPGTYTLRVLTGGQPHFQTTFTVREGTRDEAAEAIPE